MSTVHLLYGFWIPCADTDHLPSGVDARIWFDNSPKRALEISLAAMSERQRFRIVEAWKDGKLSRVYVGDLCHGTSTDDHEYLGSDGPAPVPLAYNLRRLFERYDGQEYGWHLIFTDEE